MPILRPPPALIVILKNAPSDVTLAVKSENGTLEGRKLQSAWEIYYSFYHSELKRNADGIIEVRWSGGSYDVAIDQISGGYNNIVTLNIRTGEITHGKLLSRSVMLVLLRVFLAEIAGALLFMEEHGGIRRVLFAITANLVSLVAGGYLITLLPI